jgi:hypothetical protein
MSEELDGLSVTVSKPSTGSSGNYFRGEIEEDVWHSAKLVEIKTGVLTYQGNESPAWIWIYELQDKKYAVKDDEGVLHKATITEKTSQKVTGAPRMSNAYKRYEQLTGVTLKPGQNVSLKELFGTVCKLMIKNTTVDKKEGEGTITFHNIEKISIKGLDQSTEEIANEFTEETKKNVEQVNEPKKKKEPEVKDTSNDDSDNLFDDLELD